MKVRALSLDALRGYAIITMVLSGQMFMKHMPGWMAHAQVPPNKGFDPTIFGITWVDLVFPFFLFAMGAAFPFSIGNKLQKGVSKLKVGWDIVFRAVLLIFFSIYFQHMQPFVIDSPDTVSSWLLSLFAFALMFFMFMHIDVPGLKNTKYASLGSWSVKILALLLGFILMYNLTYEGKSSPEFSPAFNNIILTLLANSALFGGIIYLFTWKKPLYRLAILPILAAMYLAGENGGWVGDIVNYTPLPWAYNFNYLQYLFIVIPGSIAGEYLYEWINNRKANNGNEVRNNGQAYGILFLSLAIIVCNTIFLYNRYLILNLIITIVLLVACYFLLKKQSGDFSVFWKRLYTAGAYFLIFGLVLEAYQGGIRKDDATYSYFFVTAGLAFFALMFFSAVCDYFQCTRSTKFLVMSGQNPMIAYVAPSMVVYSLLKLTHISDFFGVFHSNAWMGFLQGVFITTLTVLITMLFTKLKWFWRT